MLVSERRAFRMASRRGQTSWTLLLAVAASVGACNSLLDNQEGRLVDSLGSGGADDSGGSNATSGKKGMGGAVQLGDGGAPHGNAGVPGESAGAPFEAAGGTVSGVAGAPSEAGAPTEPSGGKSTRGGATSKGGAPATSGGAPATSGGRPATSGGSGYGGSTVPPGSGGNGACQTSDPSVCVNTSTVRYCNNGSLRTVACSTLCTEYGYDPPASCPSTGCTCGDAKSPDCAQGVVNYCACETCPDEVANGLYVYCYQHQSTEAATLCWATASSCEDGEASCGT